MFASTAHLPTDLQPDDRPAPHPLADIAQALAGAAVTSAPTVAALGKTVRTTLAVVQPTVSGWLRVAARVCRLR